MELAGLRVVVMGLGRFGGGVGVTRFLVQRGAKVLVTDTEPAEHLEQSLAKLNDLSVTYRLGEHRVEDFTSCDLLVANPAVKPDNRFLRAAAEAGVPITTEIALLVQHLPDRSKVVGITGTAGKSTVTAMVGYVLQQLDVSVHIGGNIGGSLLAQLSNITGQDWIVLELSSFMLHHLRQARWSPKVAVVTNLSSNHLDWHETLDAYAYDKQTLLAYQQPGDVALLGESVEHWSTQPEVKRQIIREPAHDTQNLLIPGRHNRLNATFAADVCEYILPEQREVIMRTLTHFPGLPHRLQFVAKHNDVTFYNDSKSTTPDAAMLAIDAFEHGKVRIILGGYDKGSDLQPLASHAAQHCKAVYTIGQTGDAIARIAANHVSQNNDTTIKQAGDLDAAVRHAVTDAKPGDIILLSPGCASWGQFTNYEQRGGRFVEAVLKYTTETK